MRPSHRTIRFTYRRPGKGETVYHEQFVQEGAEAQVLLMDPYDGPAIALDTTVILEPGAPLVWFVFPGAWYTIGRFHRADGTFTGWYGNLSTPVAVTENDWSSTDLFLDLWLPARGPARWLDEDEFAEAVGAGVIDRWTAQKVKHERKAIQQLLDQGAWPPAPARDLDLATIRSILQENDDT